MVYPVWSSYPLAGMRALSFIGIAVHWIILQYVLGLPFMVFLALLIYLRNHDPDWMKIARTLAKGFVVVFAVGAATGTASEFGLVLLWPNLTEAAGRYIYFPLYAEIFAFMMEVVFLYMLWYGWNRISPKALTVVALLGFLGAWYSASMIVSVNSFMVAPTGIVPAVKVENGHLVYLYDKGYPKITAAIPIEIVKLLDVKKLQAAGLEVVSLNGGKLRLEGVDTTVVIARLPVRMVQQLVREAYTGVLLKDSILMNVINQQAIAELAKDKEWLSKLVAMTRAGPYLAAQGVSLAAPQQLDPNKLAVLLGNLPVKNILDPILLATIKYVGVTTVTFKSPVYPTSIAHAIGAGLVVSGFTAMAGYAMRLLRMTGNEPEEYRRYVEKAFRYTAVFAAVMIAIQGFITGHEMGVAVAHYNPEKFAAMEGTAKDFTSIPKLLHIDGLTEKMMSLVAYGNPDVGLPEYDKIPAHYCQCQLSGQPSFDCRPPLVVHYIYYTKIGLAVLLGLYGLVVGLVAMRDRWGWADKLLRLVRIEGRPKWLLQLAIVFAVVSQIVSNMGWATREIGRKPWSIYGMMTVDVAGTTNSLAHLASSLTLVALYYIAILAVLVYAVYRILWVPGKKEAGLA
jgi:cytochrome d ubiquinol oxidase subunit I